jgi:UDP-glucose 4-epimerase
MALHLRQQGFLGTYIHNALTGKPLEVYGDGSSFRDPVYVDDVVEAFLLAGAAKHCPRSFNVGGPERLTIHAIAEITSAASHGLPVVQRAFPEALQSIDIGSYSTNNCLITRELGWRPTVSFETGIRRTLDYYSAHFERYLTAPPSFSASHAAD